MKLYNSLTKKVERFKPFNPPAAGIYSCGPTVYGVAHIGNFRTYVLTDLIHRSLEFLGYRVKLVSNITDVGHLVTDADEGEDKMEKGARREGETVWNIANKYTKIYLDHEEKLNIWPPDVRCKATDHIPEQIELVKKLEKRGFTYRTSDGIYFDTSKLPDYGQLTPQNKEELKPGARVAANPEKKNPTDFALWKFSPPGRPRQMEWFFEGSLPGELVTRERRLKSRESREGGSTIGFPGWHIECSAMSLKYLTEQFDVHVGGADLKSIHHNNEIAQSEAATGKRPVVKYWVHGELLKVDDRKMSKSCENFYNLQDVIDRGFEPLALRYLYLSSHYRSFLNFTWEALQAAAAGLSKLRSLVQASRQAAQEKSRTSLSEDKIEKIEDYSTRFRTALLNDLQIPQALAVAWGVAKSNIPAQDKLDLMADFDQVLGLKLLEGPALEAKGRAWSEVKDLPGGVRQLIIKREEARKAKDFKEADRLRKEIEQQGWLIEDTPAGPRLRTAASL